MCMNMNYYVACIHFYSNNNNPNIHALFSIKLSTVTWVDHQVYMHIKLRMKKYSWDND